MKQGIGWPSLGKVFAVAVAVGGGAVLGGAAWQRHTEARAFAAVAPRPLSSEVAVTTQLEPSALAEVRRRYDRVVDLRPDGEVEGQPSSDAMRRAARGLGLSFHYIPVPHGDIPQSAVLELRKVLDEEEGRSLLYCRSGRRAARTWALAEAGRPGGLQPQQILAAVRAAGQDADDLTQRLEAELKARGTGR